MTRLESKMQKELIAIAERIIKLCDREREGMNVDDCEREDVTEDASDLFARYMDSDGEKLGKCSTLGIKHLTEKDSK